MHPAVRVCAVAVVAAVSLTCAEQSISGVRLSQLAKLAITPVFDQAPEGGPDIDVEKIRGVLKKLNGTDSVVAEALVVGDSAILEFTNVTVTGDSTTYNLGVQAYDENNELVFEGSQELKVKPGENAPAAPALEYAASDEGVDAIAIKAGGQSVASLQLDWAGAAQGDQTCLNRAPKDPANTQQQLTVVGTAGTQTVSNVRVGWTSRDPAVATVNETGLVKARCSNKGTWVVAKTFLSVAESLKVDVAAPAFSLLMSPDSVSLERGASRQLAAIHVDENGNETAVTQVSWASSDATRAPVNSAGVVQALRNGRVLITATSGNRTTVAVVQVVRPKAARVVVLPSKDTLGVGMVRGFFAKAFDALNRVIFDATDFQWSTSNNTVATITATNGIATAKDTGDAVITAQIDGKQASADLRVLSSLPPGAIQSFVKNGETDAPIAGATISGGLANNQVVSAGDGSFTLSGLQRGDDIKVEASGFVTVILYNAPVFSGQTLKVPDLPLSPENSIRGTMVGKVVNALTGATVSGATVKVYAGLNAGPSPKRPDVQPDFVVTSISDGTFTVSNAPAGAYTFIASQSGYSNMIGVGTALGGTTKTNSPILLPPLTPPGALFAVLTWGDCAATNVPCDLDAHLTGPKSDTDPTRFQVFSGSKSYVLDGDTIAKLDVDDSNGRGPEVIGLRPSAAPGVYRFYVHNASNAGVATSRALSDSASARVDVFQDGHLIGSFFPPAGQQGTLWEVFKYDGARIFPVGTIVHPSDPAVLASPMANSLMAADPQRVAAEGRRKPKPPNQ